MENCQGKVQRKQERITMPYSVTKKKGKYIVRKKSTGKVVATTNSAKNLRGIFYHREHGK